MGLKRSPFSGPENLTTPFSGTAGQGSAHHSRVQKADILLNVC
jgi:hypothetical protein